LVVNEKTALQGLVRDFGMRNAAYNRIDIVALEKRKCTL